MKKKRPGKLWFKFVLFGLPWEVRIVPVKQRAMQNCMGLCFINAHYILLADNLSHEQYRITLAHELQHAIEDHADVDYEEGVTDDVHDRWTDQVARGWVYLLRHCPDIVEFLQGKEGKLYKVP